MCNHCGGELYYLGMLGSLLWSRCRVCGSDQREYPLPQKRTVSLDAPAWTAQDLRRAA